MDPEAAAVGACLRLRIEINPHLVNDSTPGGVFEFTTLTYEPVGWGHGMGRRTRTSRPTATWYLTG